MNLLNILKEVATGFVQAMMNRWWVEITTSDPHCTYYFGPFDTALEARKAYPGYIEDLQGEGALGVKVTIGLCRPDMLTICGPGVEC